MMPTREQYVASLSEAAQEVSRRADELFPPLDHRMKVTVSIVIEPCCVPTIEVKQEISSMSAGYALFGSGRGGND